MDGWHWRLARQWKRPATPIRVARPAWAWSMKNTRLART